MNRNCRYCTKEFEPSYKTTVYCSDECRRLNHCKRQKLWAAENKPYNPQADYQEKKKRFWFNCELCGAWRNYSAVENKRRFCSRKCEIKARVKPHTKNCEFCRKEFAYSHSQSKFCSTNCKAKFRIHFRHNRTANCPECRKEFTFRYLGESRKRKFCSTLCLNKSRIGIKYKKVSINSTALFN